LDKRRRAVVVFLLLSLDSNLQRENDDTLVMSILPPCEWSCLQQAA